MIGGVIWGSRIFGSLSDFNGDGKLDALERGMEFMAFRQIMGGGSGDEMDALEAAGLSYEELLLMDEDKRQEVLEAAGFDPDNFEF